MVLALLVTGAYVFHAARSLVDQSFRTQSQIRTDWIGAFAVEHLVAKDYPALEYAIAEAGASDDTILSIDVMHEGYVAASFRRLPEAPGIEFRSQIKRRDAGESSIGEVRTVYSTAQRDKLVAQGALGTLLTVLTIYVVLFFSLRLMLRRTVLNPVAGLIARTEQEIEQVLPASELPATPATNNEIDWFDQRFTALLEGLKRRDLARDQAERELMEHRDNLERLIEDRTRSLRLAQEEALRLNRAKSEFLAAASHDLRQPLQAIRLFHSALTATQLDPQQQRIAEYLSHSLAALGDLLNALLDISKLDAGLVKASEEAVPVEHIFEKIDAEFSPLAQQKGLRFKYYFPQRLAALKTDGHLLLSMLGNLIGNALKYTENGGILVSVRPCRGQALIQVWDTGIGIPADFSERIFEEYFQIGNPERDRSKGVGLGLSIVRRLARLLGTEVTCRSVPGRGSVFQFLLPLTDEPHALTTFARQALPISDAHDDFAGSRVVVVEDDIAVATAIRLACEALGMITTVHSRAENALADPAVPKADYFVFDFRLPGINGLELLDQLSRNAGRRLNAVILTGELASGQFASLTERGYSVLFKPMDFARLLQEWRSRRAAARLA